MTKQSQSFWVSCLAVVVVVVTVGDAWTPPAIQTRRTRDWGNIVGNRPGSRSSVILKNTNNNSIDDDPAQPNAAAKNHKKVQLAREIDDETLLEATKISGYPAGQSDEGISSISDLQKQLQQLQQRNKNPIKDYDPGDGERDGFVVDDKGNRGATNDSFSNSNDRYLELLRKAEERLAAMPPSSSSSPSSRKKRMVSNLSGLEQRLKQLQNDAAAEDGDEEEPLPEPKQLDDETLAEWEQLENQLQTEAAENKSKPRLNQEVDEAAILDALRSKFTTNGDDGDDDSNTSRDTGFDYTDNNINDGDGDNLSPDDSSSSSNNNNTDIPSGYKKYVSGFEVTDDGAVFLSPEAYQEACNTVNSDGSINFQGGDEESSPLQGAAFREDPPMAPYNTTPNNNNNKRIITLEDLAREATQSLDYARSHPEAQEELHRKIMEAEEPTNIDSDFEKEILMDPEKAAAFWNQEYYEQQKEESDLLDRLLDQKLLELQKEEEERKQMNTTAGDKDAPTKRSMPRQQVGSDRDIFFATREERIQRRRTIEQNRKERAKKIAEFYRETGENDSSWNGTPEYKEIEKMTYRPQDESDIESLESNESSNESEDHKPANLNESEDDDVHEIHSEDDEEGEWVLVEDPDSPEDTFYWNEVTGEMRWDPPEE